MNFSRKFFVLKNKIHKNLLILDFPKSFIFLLPLFFFLLIVLQTAENLWKSDSASPFFPPSVSPYISCCKFDTIVPLWSDFHQLLQHPQPLRSLILLYSSRGTHWLLATLIKVCCDVNRGMTDSLEIVFTTVEQTLRRTLNQIGPKN